MNTDTVPPQSQSVAELLRQVESDRAKLFSLAGKWLVHPGAPLLPLDMLALGAIKRNVSTAAGFRLMVNAWNMACTRSLLRIHLDTALRFSAAWLAPDPQEFARQVLRNERIDKLKDRDGTRMTDAHLVSIREAEYPWLPRVYKHLSGYVHFSGQHIYSAVLAANQTESSIEFEVTETDLNFPEASWCELIECFREATDFLSIYLTEYGEAKLKTIKCGRNDG